ncbi:unnamed protein product, partial [Mesorhabditis spiculigera]
MLKLLISVSCLFAATQAACSYSGPKCKDFINTTLAKLTTSFSVNDDIVCTIANDLGKAVASGITFEQCTSSLAANGGSYKSKLVMQKASMAGLLMQFQGCLTECGDADVMDFLPCTVLEAMNNKLAKPYKQKIQPKMAEMKAAGKSEAQRMEASCALGKAMATPALISEVTGKTMSLTWKDTWTKCIVNIVMKQNVMTLGKFIKPAFKCKQSKPSG